jgi:hypothetical protein
VDLLVQIIFFAMFLLVLFEQTNEQLSGQLQRKLLPYAKVAQAELIAFIDAVSELVPLRDVDKTHTIGDEDRDVRDRLIALASVLNSFRNIPFKDIAIRNKLLSTKDRPEDLEALIHLLNFMRSRNLSSSDVIKIVKQYHSPGAKEGLANLVRAYLSMTPSQRALLESAALSIQKPACFHDSAAFKALEVTGGYLVSNPIGEISGEFSRAVSGLTEEGDSYFVSEAELDAFGDKLTRAFPQCQLKVLEATETNSEQQYKHLNRYFFLSS